MINFCWFNSNLLIYVPVSFFIIYLIFTFVSATVEEYVTGGMEMVSEKMGLSEAMAGVTLLALGMNLNVIIIIYICKNMPI